MGDSVIEQGGDHAWRCPGCGQRYGTIIGQKLLIVHRGAEMEAVGGFRRWCKQCRMWVEWEGSPPPE